MGSRFIPAVLLAIAAGLAVLPALPKGSLQPRHPSALLSGSVVWSRVEESVVWRGLCGGLYVVVHRGYAEINGLDNTSLGVIRFPGDPVYVACLPGSVHVAWVLGLNTVGATGWANGSVIYNVSVSTGGMAVDAVTGVVEAGGLYYYSLMLLSLSSLHRYHAELIAAPPDTGRLTQPVPTDGGTVYNSTVWPGPLGVFTETAAPVAVTVNPSLNQTVIEAGGLQTMFNGTAIQVAAASSTVLLAAVRGKGYVDHVAYSIGSGAYTVLRLPEVFSGNTYSATILGENGFYVVYAAAGGAILRAYTYELGWLADIYVEGCVAQSLRPIGDIDGDGLDELVCRSGNQYMVYMTRSAAAQGPVIGGYRPVMPGHYASLHNGALRLLFVDETPAGDHVYLVHLDPSAAHDTTPPRIRLASPSLIVGGNLVVMAVAEDNESLISYMELNVSGALSGRRWSVSAARGRAVVIEENAPGDNYTVSVRAYNSVGLAAEAVFTVTYISGNPVVRITSPLNGSYVSRVLAMTVYAETPVALDARIEVNGTPVEETRLPPGYSDLSIDVSEWPDTLLLVAVKATNGYSWANASLAVYKDAVAPRLAVLHPLNGSVVSGVMYIVLRVEESHLDRVDVYIDDTLYYVLDEPGLHNLTVDTRLLGNGPHVLRVEASDAAGNTGAARIFFTVNNTVPGEPVIRYSPLVNNTFIEKPLTVVFWFNNTVAAEIYVNGVRVAAVSEPPYQYNYTVDAAPGMERRVVVDAVAYGYGGVRRRVRLVYMVDCAAPRLDMVLLSPPVAVYNGTYYLPAMGNASAEAPLHIYVDDAFIASWMLYANGSLIKSGGGSGSYFIDVSLGPGVYNITLCAVDMAGHASSKTLFIALDAEPPWISIDVEKNGSDGAILVIEITDNTLIDTVSIEVMCNTTPLYTRSFTVRGHSAAYTLPVDKPGVYGVTVVAADIAYNIGSKAAAFTLGLTNASIPVSPEGGALTANTSIGAGGDGAAERDTWLHIAGSTLILILIAMASLALLVYRLWKQLR